MRRVILSAGLAALLAFASAPAAADHTYAGLATATGLELTLADQTLTVGLTESAVQALTVEGACAADAVACATAVGALAVSETAQASAPGNEGPHTGAAIALPDTVSPLLTGQIGIARAVADGLPNASAEGEAGVSRIDITATQTLADTAPVQDALGQISEQLTPLAEGDPTGTAGRLKGTLDTLTANLADAPIASISAGPSRSLSTDNGEVTTATGSSQGAVIVVGPTVASTATAPEGLVIIEVGAASATATTDQTTAEASFDPAVVRVRVLDPTTGEYDTVEVPGTSMCVAEGTPLRTCITAGDGTTEVNGATARAVADGVSVELFADPLPTARLALAAAAAEVTAAPPDLPAVERPPLPVTGGGPALPALLLVGLGALLTVVRRRLAP